MEDITKYQLLMKMLEVLESEQKNSLHQPNNEERTIINTIIKRFEGNLILNPESYEEINMEGDKFENIQNSTIVNRSLVEKSFNKLKDDFDEETANVLKQVAGLIEESKNQEAADNFASFNEELQKPEPKKPVLKALWNGVTDALPSILQAANVAATIAKLFM